ncbi:alpha/beta fold hydrolase [Streptomyces sp. AV19]|uniref:alpha/beta hydrolase family protein n=1 Tax=Streptomyces sp. AV19 TaxID=2793068 RepID=UPI0018FE83E7|nr:alpha/beta fold hydrolase [Streptomyces sp. AV19]MBH1933785.1 alpha/beta fold hydrolase [Streptomyces sp. AV19]MDG4535711.1 alpha/beta fold hydrolase [Streptomyces sp. AV19]
MTTDTLAVAVPGQSAVLAARVTLPDGQPSGVVVIWPALGVKADYYGVFCAELTRKGFAVVCTDLRGQGASGPRIDRSARHGYHELATRDWPAVLAAVRGKFGGIPCFTLGHSLGGQISLLHAAFAPVTIDGVVLIAAGSVDYRGFSGLHGPKVLAGTHMTAVMGTVFGYWPGDVLGFAGRQSGVLMRDWARVCRTGRFQPSGADIDYETLLAKLDLPVLAVSVEGDEMAPVTAVDRLCAKVPSVELTRHHYEADADVRLDHFRWVRHSGPIANRIRAWADAYGG